MRSEAGCGGWSGRGGSGGDRKPCRHAACRAAGKACRIGNTASTTSFSIPLSCTFPPVRRTASGIPLASVRTWRFEPGLPRSVGFGPVCAPPFLPQPTRCRGRRAESRWRCVVPGGRGAHAGGGSRRRPPANRAPCASTSCRTHSPFPGAASPTEPLTAARRGYRSGRHGRQAWPTALRFWHLRRQQRLHHRPKRIRDKGPAHARKTRQTRFH